MSSTPLFVERRTHRPWWVSLSNIAYLSVYLYLMFPETLRGDPYIGVLPLHFVLFYLGLFGSCFNAMISQGRMPKLTVPLLWIALGISLHGVSKGSEFRWLIIDVSMFLGLVAGIEWAGRRKEEEVIHLLRQATPIFIGLMLFGLIGLITGVIKPVRVSARVYLYSLMHGAQILSILFPVLWMSRKRYPERCWPEWMFTAGVILGYATILFTGLYSATRNVLIGGTLSLLFFTRLAFRSRKGHLLMLVFGSVLFVLSAIDTGLIELPNLGLLAKRFDIELILEHEPRLVELQMLWDQIKGYEWIFGMGFGSRFKSVVVVEGTDLAISPHIGAITFLQKGGFILFFLVIVIPLFIGLWRIIRGKRDSMQLAWLCGAVMYIFQAFMSAGWQFHTLFLYGVCLYFGMIQAPEPQNTETVDS